MLKKSGCGIRSCDRTVSTPSDVEAKLLTHLTRAPLGRDRGKHDAISVAACSNLEAVEHADFNFKMTFLHDMFSDRFVHFVLLPTSGIRRVLKTRKARVAANIEIASVIGNLICAPCSPAGAGQVEEF